MLDRHTRLRPWCDCQWPLAQKIIRKRQLPLLCNNQKEKICCKQALQSMMRIDSSHMWAWLTGLMLCNFGTSVLYIALHVLPACLCSVSFFNSIVCGFFSLLFCLFLIAQSYTITPVRCPLELCLYFCWRGKITQPGYDPYLIEVIMCCKRVSYSETRLARIFWNLISLLRGMVLTIGSLTCQALFNLLGWKATYQLHPSQVILTTCQDGIRVWRHLLSWTAFACFWYLSSSASSSDCFAACQEWNWKENDINLMQPWTCKKVYTLLSRQDSPVLPSHFEMEHYASSGYFFKDQAELDFFNQIQLWRDLWTPLIPANVAFCAQNI